MTGRLAGRRAWLLPAALVGVLGLGIGLALALRAAGPETLAEQARVIASELRCPDCAGLSVADSPTRAAAEIRRQIDEQRAAGRSADQIKASFVARYGEWILLTPPGALPWLVPLAATGAGAGVLGWWLVGGRARGARVVAGTEAATGATPDAAPAGAGASAGARRAATVTAVGLSVLVGAGYLLPEPFGLAPKTVVNQPLAEAIATERERQAAIERLLGQLASEPTDIAVLSALADAYLAGSTTEDLQRAALTLLALTGLEPDKPEHLVRLVTAYVRAADWADAAAATDALAELDPGSPDVPFFRGLVAWQGDRDPAAAVDAFDAFLALAPDDPRVPMVRGLRAEAAAALE